MNVLLRSRACSSWIAVTAACIMLIAGLDVHAQALRVVAANSSNNNVYDVNFANGEVPGGSVSQLILDQSLRVQLVSLVFLPNPATAAVDIVAADNNRKQIVIWRAPTSTEQATEMVLWSESDGLRGPASPDGLSLDSAQNLFVTSSKPGENIAASLWVFPRNPGALIPPDPTVVPPLPLPPPFFPPLLVDSYSSEGESIQLLEETVVSGVTIGKVGVDDLLVAASDPVLVFLYSASEIADLIRAGGGPEINPTELISTGKFSDADKPTGIAFWPPDNTLLISTSGGNILQYNLENDTFFDDNFASDLGKGKFKVKTGIEFSAPIAVIADRQNGRILKFGPPPVAPLMNMPLASVTSGVEFPQGLAVTNVAGVAAGDCLAAAGGCDPLADPNAPVGVDARVLVHEIRGITEDSIVAGSLLQDPCIVASDPRVRIDEGEEDVCDGASPSPCFHSEDELRLDDVCPGFEDVLIPGHIRGNAGPSGSAFAVVQTIAPGIELEDGFLVATAVAGNILPAPLGPICPETIIGWAPVPSTEAPSVVGDPPGQFEELTGACGSSKSLRRGGSYWLIGSFNVDGLPGADDATDLERLRDFASSKYDLIDDVIAISTIQRRFAKKLGRCLKGSRRQFDRGRDLNAAGKLIECDSLVAANLDAFTSTEDVSPNPSGEIRGRLANLYLTINTRILGFDPLRDWPPLPLPSP